MRQLEINSSPSVSVLPEIAEHRISVLIDENVPLKNIINATSSEALSHLFAKILTEEAVEKDEAQITLSNTGYGFQLDDIYIAGILHQTVTDYITASNRHRILNMLNSVFEKFKEKNECNLCAFHFDEKSFVIIASFPSGTSIAKGKTKINELTQQINEGIIFLKIPMVVSFGHMYNSILDLSFSYNEAFKAMHYQIEAFSAGNSGTLSAPQYHFPPAVPADTAPVADYAERPEENLTISEAAASETPEDMDISERIDRRAAQITQLIWENREDSLSSLIDRTMTIIFDNGTLSDQEEYSKRLLSAVTSHMLSYPFVNDSHLSNVYDDLSNLIYNGTTSEELSSNLSNALDTLCQDFSEALKKQRNPYITAAQWC